MVQGQHLVLGLLLVQGSGGAMLVLVELVADGVLAGVEAGSKRSAGVLSDLWIIVSLG